MYNFKSQFTSWCTPFLAQYTHALYINSRSNLKLEIKKLNSPYIQQSFNTNSSVDVVLNSPGLNTIKFLLLDLNNPILNLSILFKRSRTGSKIYFVRTQSSGKHIQTKYKKNQNKQTRTEFKPKNRIQIRSTSLNRRYRD